MRIIDKRNSINTIVDLILTKAQYQKIIVCMDENSDVDFIDSVINRIEKHVVVLKYYYNKNTVKTFHNMINSGVRLVVYNVQLENFYKLQKGNNYIINILVINYLEGFYGF